MMTTEKPAWITGGMSPYTIAAVNQGGCASGAYMPAVCYHDAMQTMAEHGDDVLDYIKETYGELPGPPDDISWPGLAVHYLSHAMELWCSQNEELEDWNDETEIV